MTLKSFLTLISQRTLRGEKKSGTYGAQERGADRGERARDVAVAAVQRWVTIHMGGIGRLYDNA